jgi:hypothetical protein
MKNVLFREEKKKKKKKIKTREIFGKKNYKKNSLVLFIALLVIVVFGNLKF